MRGRDEPEIIELSADDLMRFDAGWSSGRAGRGGGKNVSKVDNWAGSADGETGQADDGLVRLQKALASAGVASRRACETLITKGRVRVNGKIVHELGSKIDPATDEVRVDGVVVQLDTEKRYFILNKPTGVVSTLSDEHGRPDLREFTDRVDERLYNVGRLDTDTSGLLILTNDGELAHKLAHPKFGVEKTYVAKVRGKMTAGTLQQLKRGVELEDGPIAADAAKIMDGSNREFSVVQITLHSGRNRIVRRMLAEVGHPVVALVRRQFGPLHLGDLQIGQMRELSAGERGALLTAAEGGTGERGRKVTAGRPGDGRGARGMHGVARPQAERSKTFGRVGSGSGASRGNGSAAGRGRDGSGNGNAGSNGVNSRVKGRNARAGNSSAQGFGGETRRGFNSDSQRRGGSR